MTTIAATAAPAAANSKETARTGLADNFETFLTLLTAQLRNQDPLSPMDSTQFTNQLVQFSGVEQQLKTNDLLSTLAENNRLSAGATAVAYLGKEAVAATNLAGLSQAGGEATWTYDLARPASDVRVTIKDARELSRKIATYAPGSKVKITVWRDGKEREIGFEVGRQPAA